MSRLLNMHRAVYWCAGGLVVMNSLPHILPDYTIVSYEVPGVSAPEELIVHVRKIARGMGLRNPDRIQVFISSGYSSLSGGSTALPTGAFVGLPRVVLFRGPEDVVSSNATLGDQLVSWDSPEGHALLKLLPPSTNVINFRIAHEIAHLKNQDIVWSIAVSPVFLVAGYHLAVFLCKRVFSANIPLAFLLLFSMTIFVYAEINAVINHWLEYRADRVAALCSKKYAEGGVEWLKNRLQLDALLRLRATSVSRGIFSVFSNHHAFTIHPAADKRLQRLEELFHNFY